MRHIVRSGSGHNNDSIFFKESTRMNKLSDYLREKTEPNWSSINQSYQALSRLEESRGETADIINRTIKLINETRKFNERLSARLKKD
jgi:hypothetical protein